MLPMEIQDFWNIYAGGYSPAEFVWRFGKGNAAVSVKEYTNSCPAMYGIVRSNTWKETFATAEQYNRERVSAALLTHLELTRETWESHVQEYAATEAAARLAEQKRAEAEALAAAIARVEAEAREKAAREVCAADDHIPEHSDDLPQELPEPDSFHSLGLSQARTAEDAAAIVAAMARVEAEAREKAATEVCPAENHIPEKPVNLSPELPEPNSFHSLGLSQARTAEDAAAIAAAMARVEAEAREKAAREAQEQQQPVSTILQTEFVEPNHAVPSEQDGSPNV